MGDISKRQIGFIKGLYKKYHMEISSSELEGMSSTEASNLIQKMLKGGIAKDATKEKETEMKMKIISMGHTIGWQIPGTEKINMERINNWCVKYGMYNKPLDKHTYTELTHLVTQFKNGPFTYELQQANG